MSIDRVEGRLPQRQRSAHRISNVDPEAMTCDCVICGPGVRVRLRIQGGLFTCRRGARGNHDRERWRRPAKYGISAADVLAMEVAQGGLCAICGGAPEPPLKLNIDHDHATGQVRGLLCRTCNWGIGNFRDDPALLEAAIRFLNRSA